MSDPDVVIVGAGAAGVGAGLALRDRGVSCVIVEAAARVGGRAFTDAASLPVPWDHGCHWLHSADVNPLVAWADRLGATYRREIRENHVAIWRRGEFLPQTGLAEARDALRAAYAAIDAAAAEGRDVAVTDVLPDAGEAAAGVRSILGLMAGDDAGRVSAAGYADYVDTDANWPVLSGYGDLIARMAEGLPVRLGVAATAVQETAGGVRVETAAGAIAARAAIVTVSTNVLISGAIRFGAGPARDLLEHVADVPCGAYEKVAFALRTLPPECLGKLFCVVEPAGAPPLEFQIVAGAPPLLIAHVAGDLARDLAAAGPDEAIAFAGERLAAAFGAAARKDVLAAAMTGWTRDPLVQGSYSHAKPGAAHRRRAMIAADTGRVAFAGEAFSLHAQATAHGAYESGRAAAARVLRFVEGAR